MPIIQSLDRALKILELFDEQNKELKISEISSKLNLNKSTAHSLLKTLKQHDYIKQNSDSGKYSLGLKLLERGQFVLNSMDIRTLSREYLVNLSATTAQTAHLVVLEGKSGVYIDKVEGSSTIVFSRVGRRVPIHSSAVGKVLVAFKSDKEIEHLLENYDFYKQTNNTITSKQAYLEELRIVVNSGLAVDNEENEPGVCCFAVPLFNHTGTVIAAISVSTTVFKLTPEMRELIMKKLKETALEISHQLGYQKSSLSG
ncbi:IclR family transcriptional regulator [Aquibacillus albus]|uniref:DNA-binding IclR family transcriptional regulator n=1 Tax=Aquibacillus albus TaxID=1168171 RepID=A0ABS2MWP4_9BACI|nr:IclR family transcriptional regulator [Aquibacillus albus]MBM7570321.1 DNA-binding IclR family transcriptional regulator [Aquibacillus albus]